jgi:hypothetical protein
VRIYLSENGGAIDTGMLAAANLIPQLRTAADLVADITPPPPGVFLRARKVLETHTAAVCARLDGSRPAADRGAVSDEFIPALRAEAHGPDSAVAALPLVAAAANIGELELSYSTTPAGTVSS